MPPESESPQPEIISGPLVPPMDRPPSPRYPRRQTFAFGVCMLLLVLAMVAERVHIYFSQATQVHSSSTLSESPVVSPIIKNELQPLTGEAGDQSGNQSASQSANPAPSGVISSAVPPITPIAPIVSANPLSSVTALAYLVGNVKTGQIYLSRNASEILPIASLSKLTTALVARQFMSQSVIVPITQEVLDVYPDAYGLELGERFSVSELYYPMLLQSNDNAAEAFAYAYGANASGTDTATEPDTASSTDTAFVGLMNEYAAELGMTHTHFLDATGLTDQNVSTPSDLFLLAQFLYADKFSDKLFTPNIFAITTLPSVSVATTSEHLGHDFVNINPFAGDADFVGGKTGRTYAAGETMLSIFNYQSDGQGSQAVGQTGQQAQTDPIVVIILHSDWGSRQEDTEKLLDVVEQDITAGKY